VCLIHFTTFGANDWLKLNQFSVSESHHNRRPDLVVFINPGQLPFLLVGPIRPGRQIIA
jgi:type I site-specific restriction-modification system R (restriction) subunit